MISILIDLMKTDDDRDTSDFLDTLTYISSSYYLPNKNYTNIQDSKTFI